MTAAVHAAHNGDAWSIDKGDYVTNDQMQERHRLNSNRTIDKTTKKYMTTLRNNIPLLTATLLLSMPILADDINCAGDYGDETLDGNLFVAVSCTLDGTRVKGNVELFAGGSLTATFAVIDGKVSGKNADFVDIRNSEIAGDVKLEDLVGDRLQILDGTMRGNVTLKDNRSPIDVGRNFIEGNLQISGNSGGVRIADNVIDGNLDCRKNVPAPEGGNNQVRGNKKDQCSNIETVEEPGPGNGGDTDAGGDGASGGSGTPLELNTGTGGGGATSPLLALLLLLAGLLQHTRRRDTSLRWRAHRR